MAAGSVTFSSVPELPVALTMMGMAVTLGYNGTPVPMTAAPMLTAVGIDVEFVHSEAVASVGKVNPVPIDAVTMMVDVSSEVTVEVLFVLEL